MANGAPSVAQSTALTQLVMVDSVNLEVIICAQSRASYSVQVMLTFNTDFLVIDSVIELTLDRIPS